MAGSNLTGTFIANTYQKLLQVDNVNGASGTGSFTSIDQTNLNSTSKFDLLDGLGDTVPYLSVNHGGSPLGGIFLKNSPVETGTWGIQIANSGDSLNTPGLNIRKLGLNSGEAKLFLKRTGTAWIGYDGGFLGTPPGLEDDVLRYSLYVKDGIRVGKNETLSHGRINLIGANPLENGAGMFINGEYPFRTLRYKYSANFNDDRTRKITDSDNTTFFSTNEWSAHVTGIYMNSNVNTSDAEGLTAIMINDSGSWAIKFNIFNDTAADKSFVIDVLLIRKGFYDDLRNLDGNQINAGGSELNPLTPLI